MGAKALTPELYEKLLDAFRESPANYARAAGLAGCAWRTAKTAWHEGWARKPYARPIRDVLDEERDAARALRQKQEHEANTREQDRAIQERLSAIDARAQENKGAKLSRENAINLAIVSGKALIVVDKMVEELNRRLVAGLATMDSEEIRRWVSSVGTVMHRAESVMKMALEIEREVRGNPIASQLGPRVTSQLTPDQMLASLNNIGKTLARAAKRNTDDVIDAEVTAERSADNETENDSAVNGIVLSGVRNGAN